jgi:hypothetical protein
MKATIAQIDTIGECSTGDITKNDALLLDKEEGNCLFRSEYGYLIYQKHEDEEFENFIKELKVAGFSEYFISLHRAMKEQGLRYLRIDCEGTWAFPDGNLDDDGFQIP